MKRIATLLLGGALSACTVGPHDLDAHASLPPAPVAQRFAPATGPSQATRIAPVPADWWRSFGNAQLDALVDEALAHATDIAVADAALRQAQEQAGATAGSALPQVDASYQAERQRVSNALSPAVADQNQQLYTLHTAQVTVAYGLDLFGGTRARIRSARAAAAVQGHRLDAARASVVANLVQAVIQRAALADQIAAARTSITVNRDILQALTRQQQLGAVGAADIATQQTALAGAESALPPLIRAEEHQRVMIGTLIGRAAGSDLPALPTLASLILPAELPLALPSDLVARRPDVLAAQAQLEGAGADVGTAIAARLPSIQLSASAGGIAQRFPDMFASGNPFWALIGGITQPIFHAGALRHQQRAAEAALDGAKAQYRAAVLQAFGDVSDALTGLATDADALDAATRASMASGRALTFVQRQLALGDVGTLALLNATGADAQARSQLVQARAARLTDTVALFQAAGGPIAAAR
ncbi:efflux transporter outer membrane subunit [Sphingomonas sp. KR1UV-12]|uniref:Efflux transporter outer membrane subunit n=1 Tax=Sphingomonas aurea TaxID=3063994 RepID=A0ABT9ELT6_9SPHN|nr:efflux transporter outer membrane subunit [Sphingomonas sp. KR1UV-12]MDP1027927.1 efflux transporter outer membrane subunit [Sphingomonas sp. KR1UV-12]